MPPASRSPTLPDATARLQAAITDRYALDRELDPTAPRPRRDPDPLLRLVGDRVEGVHEQVHERLRELHRPHLDGERFDGPILGELDARDVGALAEKRQRLLDEALEAWTRDGGWAAFTADALAALQDVAEAAPKGRDAVVVSSGGVIGALAAGLLGAPAATGIALNRVAVNGAITLVAVGGRGAHLLTFNDHAHFTGPRRELLTYR
jgi:broad specificity phosphatase PhoE